MRRGGLAVLVLALAACGTPVSPLIPEKAIMQLTSDFGVTVAGLAGAAAVVLVYDPLAPNWEIEEVRQGEDVFRYALKMKRFHTGGAGEALQVLHRRAARMQREQGYGAYQLLDYSEGIESQTLGARRFAEGTLKLVQRLEADSFLQGGY